MYQAIVRINGLGIHIHSQVFETVEELEKQIEKNEAYEIVGIIEPEFKYVLGNTDLE